MNFELFCMQCVHGSLKIVQKMYFDDVADALAFRHSEDLYYKFVSIRALNAEAEKELERVGAF